MTKENGTIEAMYVGGPYDGRIITIRWPCEFAVPIYDDRRGRYRPWLIPMRETSAGYRLLWNEGEFL